MNRKISKSLTLGYKNQRKADFCQKPEFNFEIIGLVGFSFMKVALIVCHTLKCPEILFLNDRKYGYPQNKEILTDLLPKDICVAPYSSSESLKLTGWSPRNHPDTSHLQSSIRKLYYFLTPF